MYNKVETLFGKVRGWMLQYQIEYSKKAVKAIQSMDKQTKARIRAGIEALPAGDVKPMRGSDGSFRLRVGDWRILFSYPEAGTILIEKVAPRGDVYKGA